MSRQSLITSWDHVARPRSEDRRNAILAATVEVIAEQGLGAPTAAIAKRAGVPHGSVFTYFETKTELLNVLYLELTRALTDTVLAVMPAEDDTRAQFHHLWVSWTSWGVSHPSKRRVQAQLNVSDQVSELNRNAAYDESNDASHALCVGPVGRDACRHCAMIE